MFFHVFVIKGLKYLLSPKEVFLSVNEIMGIGGVEKGEDSLPLYASEASLLIKTEK